MIKTCRRCKEDKEVSNFCKNKATTDGYACYCRPCFSLIKKKIDPVYSKSEKGKKSRSKAWKKYVSKPEVKKRRNELRRLRKEQERQQKLYRRLFDPLYKLKCSLRRRFLIALKRKSITKNNSLFNYLGCSIEELKQHLESKFQEGMTWENHGKWHIDHIVPLATANDEISLLKLFHYTNLQPLWAYDNISKGSK